MARHLTALLAIAVAAGLGACGDGASDGDRPAGDSGAGLPRGAEPFDLDPATFSADVDSRYWPMRPGTRWTYRETDPDGTALKVVVTATGATRRLANGVVARVVRDSVSEDGELVEDTLDWYAQDRDGNVWYMGERTVELEDGEVVTRAGSWEAGVDGALPGIAIPADPADGMRYRQEHYTGEAEDRGEVVAVGERVDVPAGHYDDVVLTRDTNPLEPRVLEYKLYAPGVGPVLAIGVAGSGGREELVAFERVAPRVAAAAASARLGSPYP